MENEKDKKPARGGAGWMEAVLAVPSPLSAAGKDLTQLVKRPARAMSFQREIGATGRVIIIKGVNGRSEAEKKERPWMTQAEILKNRIKFIYIVIRSVPIGFGNHLYRRGLPRESI